jgi:beta-carotene 15,15'-dioxygenase
LDAFESWWGMSADSDVNALRYRIWAMAASVLCAGWVEYQQPHWIWPIFVLMVGGLGFFHGILDTALLVHLHRPLRWAAMYLLSVVLMALVFSATPGLALLFLVALSLWHFGESATRGVVAIALRTRLLRLALGGASVMLPVLLSAQAMQILLVAMLPSDTQWVWLVWRGMAWGWLCLAVLGVSWILYNQVQQQYPLVLEICCVIVLNGCLSPLMAFALYFGLHHSLGHIRSVWRFSRGQVSAMLVLTTVVVASLTVALVAAVVGWYGDTSWQAIAGIRPPDLILRSVVVALAALTLPHALLVQYFSKKLAVH